jgi:hypothetical protein
MATKPKSIEDMSEAELTERSTKAYDKARTSPEPGGFDTKPTPKRGKTGIEDAAMEKAASDDYKKFGSVQGSDDDQRQQGSMQAASRAARSEIKRETKGMAPKAYAKGGTASSRGDGIAQRGKTRGTIVMCGGGMARKK